VASWVPGVRGVTDEKQLWAELTRDPRQPAVLALRDDLPDSVRTLEAGPAQRQPARVERFENNHLTLDVDAPSAGVLVVNEAWFPFWKATVDGHATNVFPVEDWVRGVELPAGRHHVEMTFRPTAWLAAASLSVLTWLGLGALAIWGLWRRKRSAPPASPTRSDADGEELAHDSGS
jgi:hypothetical protein